MMAAIIVCGVAFGIVIVVTVVVVYMCMKKGNGTGKGTPRERCTVRVTGTLLSVTQMRSGFSTNGNDSYTYSPFVRYEYNGQVYETESKQFSAFWEMAEKNTELDVFVNPEDANDIYVPVPEAALEKDRKRKKIVFICLLVYFVIAGSVVLIQHLLK